MLDGSSIGLLSLVTGRLRELLCARSLAARGAASQLASELGKQDWQVKNHVRWARAFAEGELEGLLDACARTERALKSGADEQAEMVRLIARVCGVA